MGSPRGINTNVSYKKISEVYHSRSLKKVCQMVLCNDVTVDLSCIDKTVLAD